MPIIQTHKILREATRGENEPLNILCSATHESYETTLAKTGHNFFSMQLPMLPKKWDKVYRPVPPNYTLLDERRELGQIPLYLDIDIILSQNKEDQYKVLVQMAQQLGIPLVTLEHTLPIPKWNDKEVASITKSRLGDINVYISEYSQQKWFGESDSRVVRHAIDSELFKPDFEAQEPIILSVVNEWKSRDWCCNYSGWERIAAGLPTKVVGKNPGWTAPAKSVDELVRAYQTAGIFLNTSTISPVPTSLLEAMACGCAVVSTATCMIPEVIQSGVNGFISNDEKELKDYLQFLLTNPQKRRELGVCARNTILKDFSVDRFCNEWNKIFYEASNRVLIK